MSVRSGPYDGPILQQLLTCFPAAFLSCRNPAAPRAILPAGAGGESVIGRTFRGVNGCLIASISARFGASLPLLATRSLWQRHIRSQERARGRRVEPEVDVRRAAGRVPGDGRRGDGPRLARTGAEEVRAARVSITGASISMRGVLRDPQEVRRDGV